MHANPIIGRNTSIAIQSMQHLPANILKGYLKDFR